MCSASNPVCATVCVIHILIFLQHHRIYSSKVDKVAKGSVSVSYWYLWIIKVLVLWWIPLLFIICSKNKCLLGPNKRMDTTCAFVWICGWILVCPTVTTCGFQCPKLCGDCMPYIKTKESVEFSFSFFFFFYINIDLWSTQFKKKKVNSLNNILLWRKSCVFFLNDQVITGCKQWYV